MSDERIIFGAAAIPEPDRDWLAAAERLPIASVWQGGHVLPPSATGEAITRLALLTAWTERVRVGTAVLQLPLYQPVIAAKQLADLDARSGGRVSVGIGVGGEFRTEFDAVGVPVGERGPRTDEAMRVLRTLWRGGPVAHHGRFFRFDDVELRPVRPPGEDGPGMRPGGPPLLVSGRKRPAMRRAARLGDGWMPYLMSPEAYARSVAAVREEADAAGRDLAGFEWMLYLYCSVRRDGDRARDDVAGFLGGAYGGRPEAMLDRIAPAGTPDEVAARLQRYVDAGVRHFVIAPAAHAGTLEVVRLAAEEVLPRLTIPAPASTGAAS
ncbi:LLM class flavin-dependent oxidoreductase [Actinomadura algeriensis]|uniref:Alkanesulfonate monooxygenase SsuD/methylene tetrahydromethanopterin reductase-like flavin-dependent oxidoreductase (Luciferase family) n=1 Tax=Actinomadura algeriensis TaxID=1679523 RepID=A0ABR9K416_9ACTN|nr:LLM class flavin-dependent oxidoreductase [Actinomadura algeriensis]MBE1537105.1 alkanesulfonate monooxygenase SsuD/methylene tetrahydromethanopterin reductase-like flavin-dependent oxidoreductase (luciferase family) [Actinomadura algeriensis]